MAADEYKTTLTDGTELVLSRTDQTVQIRQATGIPNVERFIQIHADDLYQLGMAIGELIHNNKGW
jgi:hypothetical protein